MHEFRRITRVLLALLAVTAGLSLGQFRFSWNLARVDGIRGLGGSVWAAQPPDATELRDEMSVGSAPACTELDPNQDGWGSEAFTEKANKQLALLGAWISTPDAPATALDPLLDPEIAFTQPPKLDGDPDHRAGSIAVWREKTDSTASPAELLRGKVAFANSMAAWFAPLRQCVHPHVKFKVVGVELENDVARTVQIFAADGFMGANSDTAAVPGGMEVHARVELVWHFRQGEPPAIKEFRIEDVELCRIDAGKGAWLVDRGPEIMSHVSEYDRFLRDGLPTWMKRMPGFMLAEFGHHGLAIGDVNGDDRDDVYVCQPGGFPNLLLIQQPDGTVRNTSAAAGVDFLDLCRSALLVDFDNDGDTDLAVATSNRLVLLTNDGKGNFQQKGVLKTVRDANSISATDFDQDGDLDIYACIYSHDGDVARGSPTPIPIHDARNGGRNILLRNDGETPSGEWQFTDTTDEVGLNQDNDRWSYAACWEDYDDDGDADLIVANDFGRNNLYRNTKGKFENVATAAGLDESAFGMSAAWGDYDHDGHMDLYIGNMFSGAGNRVTNQDNFQRDAPTDIRKALRQAAQGNALFRNLGNGRFENVAEKLGVQYGRWAWGSLFVDLNNDSWEELLVANGFVTSDDPDDL